MAGVEIRRLSKHYGDVRAVDGVDLSIRDGELLVLLGSSGCGKTTLLRMIAGLEIPSSGDILIGGMPADRDVPPRARGIAMVFQSYALYPHRTIFDNIAFPLRASRTPPTRIEEKVQWAAGLLHIRGLLDRLPRQLSGGERQRVALARAMVRDPRVFLLDEPLANLDTKLRNSARDELKRFQRGIATTAVYVTHDQVEAMGLGDRIAIMERGRVRQVGTPEQVYEDPVDTFVATFVGQPPMNLVARGDGDGDLVGFRPEHLLPRGAYGAAEGVEPFCFSVRRIEYLGADRHLYGVVSEGEAVGGTVIAKLTADLARHVREGERQPFAVPRRALYHFDPRTGRRRNP